MATLFRAIVMLAVLVGLPAAWVYYGPLPPAAMGVVQRTFATARASLGWETRSSAGTWTTESPRTAPRFDPVLSAATARLSGHRGGEPSIVPTPRVKQDSQFVLASAISPASSPSSPFPPASVSPEIKPLHVDEQLASQLEPHLSLLRSLGAEEYTLENWGGEGKFFRFRCAIGWGETPNQTQGHDHTRQFEAVDADPLRAVHQVVGEVTAWQNALGNGGNSGRWR